MELAGRAAAYLARLAAPEPLSTPATAIDRSSTLGFAQIFCFVFSAALSE
jgi:hypothetical protein